MKTLISFSGGYDSTFLLYKLLNERNDEITAIRMNLSQVNAGGKRIFEGLAAAEDLAVPQIIDWMSKKFRPVQLIKVDVDELVPGGYVSWTLIHTAKNHAARFDRFVYSRSLENERSTGRLTWLKDNWSRMVPGVPMETPLIDLKLGRPHAMKDLPADLQELMFSCDDPRVDNGSVVICQVCNKCKISKMIKEKKDIDPNILFDFYLRKMAVGPYIGKRSGQKEFRAGQNLRPWLNYQG